MAVHLTPQLRQVLVRLIGPLAFVALVLIGSVAASRSAAAAPVCGERDEILKSLEQRHEEHPSASGCRPMAACWRFWSHRMAAGPSW